MRIPIIAAFILYLVASFASGPHAGQSRGSSVWDGVFTAEQAARGARSFGEHCAECHGNNLEGESAKPLSGDRFWVDWQETDVDYLLDQISKNMPFSEDASLAGTLDSSTYVDVVAHILQRNGFPAGGQALTRESGTGVRIMRRDGPGELPGDALAQVVGCLARGTGGWRLVNATRPVRVLSSRPAPPTNTPLGDRTYDLKFVLTPLEKFAGHRMAATGKLMGDGGRDGLNVTTIRSVGATCE